MHLARFPRLLQCTIRGQQINYCAFEQFLEDNQSIKTIDLRFVDLSGSGTWRGVFEKCRHLDNLTLRRLSEDRRSVHLISQLAIDDGYQLTANNDQLQRGIQYDVSQFDMGSLNNNMQYRQERRREHGPPILNGRRSMTESQ